MVGRGGLEPPTSRLSGVRSNHLSYRPQPCLFTLKSECEFGGANRDRTDDLKLAKLALSQLSYGPLVLKPISAMVHSFECFPEMKGSEDGVL